MYSTVNNEVVNHILPKRTITPQVNQYKGNYFPTLNLCAYYCLHRLKNYAHI